MRLINRAGPGHVALETTLLAHGLPRETAADLIPQLKQTIRVEGVEPAFVGVRAGEAVVGLTDDELRSLLDLPSVTKANTANLGLVMHRREHGATTVSATMELAAAAGVRIFATGGIGGVHTGYGARPDVSADLSALARFPVAVVASGPKSLLDTGATRELLETLGVPVVGFRTDSLPAFYLCDSGERVDARFDDAADLAEFVSRELDRTGHGLLIANPIPPEAALPRDRWERWQHQATQRVAAESPTGRDITPRVLAALHEVSGGATLRANLALIRANATLAARLCRHMTRAAGAPSDRWS